MFAKISVLFGLCVFICFGGPKKINFEELISDFEGENFNILGRDLKTKTTKYYESVSSFFKGNESLNTSSKSKKSLGVRVGWSENHFGVKYYSLVLPEKNLKRDVKTLTMFVWSAKYKAKIYLKVNDFSGKDRFLYFSDLNYYGWKRLTIDVPQFINGGVEYRPLDNLLSTNSVKVKEIRVEVDDEEKRDIFIFFDRLSYFFDTIVDRNYDGFRIEEILLNEKQQGIKSVEEKKDIDKEDIKSLEE